MPDIDAAASELSGELKKTKADYVEARFEENQASQITYRGKTLESIGRSSSSGGNVRALFKGGWGFTSFNALDNLPDRVSLAVEQARVTGSGKSQLAQVDPAKDNIPSGVAKNPVNLPLAEKKRLVDEYNEIIWSTPQIKTSNISYSDSRKKVVFLNSEGSFITQERADVNLRLTAIAAKDSEVQQVGISTGEPGRL